MKTTTWRYFLIGLLSILAMPMAFALSPSTSEEGEVLAEPVNIRKFDLNDHNQTPFNNARFANKWTVLFFGYTHCSDVCPTTLAVLDRVYKKLGNKDTIQFVFVSVDPHRDTLARIREHVSFFNSEFLGVTGDIKDLNKLSWSLGARFDYRDAQSNEKIRDVTKPPKTDNYIVGHMSDLFVISPQGTLVGTISPPPNVSRTVEALNKIRSTYDARAFASK